MTAPKRFQIGTATERAFYFDEYRARAGMRGLEFAQLQFSRLDQKRLARMRVGDRDGGLGAQCLRSTMKLAMARSGSARVSKDDNAPLARPCKSRASWRDCSIPINTG